MEVFIDRYGIEIQTSSTSDPFTFCKAVSSNIVEALEEAYNFHGDPKTGLMAVDYDGVIAYSDGIDPNTGQNYTPEMVDMIKSVCNEVIIA